MDIYNFLEHHKIPYKRLDHEPVFTCEEADALVPPNEGADLKNLFLKDRKGRNHFLVVLGSEKQVNLKALSTLLEVKDLSFASPERLLTFLGVTPGSVTALALLNDSEKQVQLVFDRELWASEYFGFHPLINTATLVIAKGDLERFFQATGHEARIVEIP